MLAFFGAKIKPKIFGGIMTNKIFQVEGTVLRSHQRLLPLLQVIGFSNKIQEEAIFRYIEN